MTKFVLACAAVLFTQAAWADTANYKCEITKTDSHGWIAPDYYFQIDSASGDAKALSGHHDWTEAKLKVLRDGGYRLFWNVTLRSSTGYKLRMKYQANLDAEKSAVRIRASFANINASNKPFGTGVCNIFQG